MSPLKRKRVALGMTVEDLSKKVGVSPSAVSYWEIGRRQPKPHYYAKLSKALKVSPEQLADLVSDTSDACEARTRLAEAS